MRLRVFKRGRNISFLACVFNQPFDESSNFLRTTCAEAKEELCRVVWFRSRFIVSCNNCSLLDILASYWTKPSHMASTGLSNMAGGF